MNKLLLTLIFAVFGLNSCKNIQPKVQLFHNYEAFMLKAESQFATSTDEEWNKLESENNDFITQIEKRELTEFEQKSFQQLKGKFIGLQGKRLAQKAKKKMNEFLDLGQGVLDELIKH